MRPSPPSKLVTDEAQRRRILAQENAGRGARFRFRRFGVTGGAGNNALGAEQARLGGVRPPVPVAIKKPDAVAAAIGLIKRGQCRKRTADRMVSRPHVEGIGRQGGENGAVGKGSPRAGKADEAAQADGPQGATATRHGVAHRGRYRPPTRQISTHGFSSFVQQWKTIAQIRQETRAPYFRRPAIFLPLEFSPPVCSRPGRRGTLTWPDKPRHFMTG